MALRGVTESVTAETQQAQVSQRVGAVWFFENMVYLSVNSRDELPAELALRLVPRDHGQPGATPRR